MATTQGRGFIETPVASAKIGNLSVTTVKINTGAVTEPKLAADDGGSFYIFLRSSNS